MDYDYGYSYGYDQIPTRQDIAYDNQYMMYPKKQNAIYRNIPIKKEIKKDPAKEQAKEQAFTDMSVEKQDVPYLQYFIIFLFIVILMKIDNMMSHIQLIQLSLSKSSTK
jgi:hypothetical protein